VTARRPRGPRPTELLALERAVQQIQPRLRGPSREIRQIDWQMVSRTDRGAWFPEDQRIGIHREISPLIERALGKLDGNEPLTFREADALRTLWHEINHSRGSQNFAGYRTDPLRRFEIEVVNELHTRLRFDQFIERLGFDTRLVPDASLVGLGTGYQWFVQDMRRILETVGLSRSEATVFFERLNLERDTQDYLDAILDLIAHRLQLDEMTFERLRRRTQRGIHQESLKEVRRMIERLSQKKEIKPESWI